MRFATLARSLFITLCFRLGTRLASSGRSTNSSLGFRLALEIISLVRGFVSLQNIPTSNHQQPNHPTQSKSDSTHLRLNPLEHSEHLNILEFWS
ncbi:uncharacterized protein BKA78DRAFT_320754 [Phyllosticta capitalensis]|uniref:uncharacterized protein n=1 Tax=Phyllosticta capitalensis TaxID=121624 RepID=UPI00313071D1